MATFIAANFAFFTDLNVPKKGKPKVDSPSAFCFSKNDLFLRDFRFNFLFQFVHEFGVVLNQ